MGNEHAVNKKNTMFEFNLDGIESLPPKSPINCVFWVTIISFGAFLMVSQYIREIIFKGLVQLFVINILMTVYYLRCVSRVPKTSFILHESLSETTCQMSKRMSMISQQFDERLKTWISFGLSFIQ